MNQNTFDKTAPPPKLQIGGRKQEAWACCHPSVHSSTVIPAQPICDPSLPLSHPISRLYSLAHMWLENFSPVMNPPFLPLSCPCLVPYLFPIVRFTHFSMVRHPSDSLPSVFDLFSHGFHLISSFIWSALQSLYAEFIPSCSCFPMLHGWSVSSSCPPTLLSNLRFRCNISDLLHLLPFIT